MTADVAETIQKRKIGRIAQLMADKELGKTFCGANIDWFAKQSRKIYVIISKTITLSEHHDAQKYICGIKKKRKWYFWLRSTQMY